MSSSSFALKVVARKVHILVESPQIHFPELVGLKIGVKSIFNSKLANDAGVWLGRWRLSFLTRRNSVSIPNSLFAGAFMHFGVGLRSVSLGDLRTNCSCWVGYVLKMLLICFIQLELLFFEFNIAFKTILMLNWF